VIVCEADSDFGGGGRNGVSSGHVVTFVEGSFFIVSPFSGRVALRANICHPCHSSRKAYCLRFFTYTCSPVHAAVRLIIHSHKESSK